MQNLANKPTHQKELYMNSLNFFLDENKDLMNKFLNDLADVSDFTEALEVRFGSFGSYWFVQMEQYIALSKKEIDLNILINELHHTHSLLMKHKDSVVRFSALFTL